MSARLQRTQSNTSTLPLPGVVPLVVQSDYKIGAGGCSRAKTFPPAAPAGPTAINALRLGRGQHNFFDTDLCRGGLW